MKNKIWICLLLLIGIILINSCIKDDNSFETVTAIDGNVYHSVLIGKQVWMVENLSTTRFRNGDPIPYVTDSSSWISLTSSAYCNYDNDTNISVTYGKLYNWYAVTDNRNIAPVGWHIPSYEEWEELITYLGGNNVAVGKLKEQGTIHWQYPNSGATNESGFTALPSGIRSGRYGDFSGFGYICYFWSPTDNCTDGAIYGSNYTSCFSILYYNDGPIYTHSFNKKNGLSVRCIKD